VFNIRRKGLYEALQSHGATPTAGWFRMENPKKMKDFLGIPIAGWFIYVQNGTFYKNG